MSTFEKKVLIWLLAPHPLYYHIDLTTTIPDNSDQTDHLSYKDHFKYSKYITLSKSWRISMWLIDCDLTTNCLN